MPRPVRGYALAKGTLYKIIFCAFQNHILNKRTQFAANLRLLGKGVNARDFYNTLQKQKPRFLLLPFDNPAARAKITLFASAPNLP